MKIGFTGTQIGMSDFQKRRLQELLRTYRPDEFHPGVWVGAAAVAHAIAKRLGLRVVIHPPIMNYKRAFCAGDEVREPKEYLTRNHDIVDECDMLVAAPKSEEEEIRSGTWATIRYAKRLGKLLDRMRR